MQGVQLQQEPYIDEESLDFQFDGFCDFMVSRVGYYSSGADSAAGTKLLWQDALLRNVTKTRLSEYCKLAHVLLCLPVGSVENERAFSLMNLVKSPVRNKLQEEHLNVCCRLKRSAHTLQSFPFAAAAKIFHSKSRRMESRTV